MYTTEEHLRARRIRRDDDVSTLALVGTVPPPPPPPQPRDALHYPAHAFAGETVAWGRWDGAVEVGEQRLQAGHSPVSQLALSAAGDALVTAPEEWRVDLWTLPAGISRRLMSQQGTAVCFSEDGSVVGVATRALSVELFDRGGERLWRRRFDDWEQRGEVPARLFFCDADRVFVVEGDQATLALFRLGEGAPPPPPAPGETDERVLVEPAEEAPLAARRDKPPAAIGTIAALHITAGVLELTMGWWMASMAWMFGGVFVSMVCTLGMLGPLGAMAGMMGMLLLPLGLVELTLGVFALGDPKMARSTFPTLSKVEIASIVCGGFLSFIMGGVTWMMLQDPEVQAWLRDDAPRV